MNQTTKITVDNPMRKPFLCNRVSVCTYLVETRKLSHHPFPEIFSVLILRGEGRGSLPSLSTPKSESSISFGSFTIPLSSTLDWTQARSFGGRYVVRPLRTISNCLTQVWLPGEA